MEKWELSLSQQNPSKINMIKRLFHFQRSNKLLITSNSVLYDNSCFICVCIEKNRSKVSEKHVIRFFKFPVEDKKCLIGVIIHVNFIIVHFIL